MISMVTDRTVLISSENAFVEAIPLLHSEVYVLKPCFFVVRLGRECIRILENSNLCFYLFVELFDS